MMTEEQLQAIRERYQSALRHKMVCHTDTVKLITDDIPALLEEVEELLGQAKARAHVNNALCEALRMIMREPEKANGIATSILYDINQLPEQWQTPAEKQVRSQQAEIERLKREVNELAYREWGGAQLGPGDPWEAPYPEVEDGN
jgi:hypothetical protein